MCMSIYDDEGDVFDEPDYEAIAEARAEARAERMAEIAEAQYERYIYGD